MTKDETMNACIILNVGQITKYWPFKWMVERGEVIQNYENK